MRSSNQGLGSIHHARLLGTACALVLGVLASQPASAADEPKKDDHPIIVEGIVTQPLDQSADTSKTGTALKDLPRSVQVVSHELLDQQGGTRLTDALQNVSSATQGGQFAFGFYDRIALRGLNPTYLTDGLPDGTSELGGIPHSILGVERIEIMKGPGSALYGNGAQGGMINLVHYRPSDTFGVGVSAQYGSFDTSTLSAYVTGPLADTGFAYRIDAGDSRTDGFRGAGRRFIEFLPALSFHGEQHDIQLRVEIRDIDTLPDASGIPFSPPTGIGLPAPVSPENRYYTPFARGNQNISRILASDAWTLSDAVTINNRLSYTHRTVDILRNAGGTVTCFPTAPATTCTTLSEYGLRSRQLRRQNDRTNDLVWQLEPVFHVDTGGIKHTILTGFQAQEVDGHVNRVTADLPNIASLAAPVIPETSEAAFTFLCNASHSCADADITARFYSVYATDQVDVTDALKLRLSARNDWVKTRGVATSVVPANPGMQQPCNPPTATLCAWLPGVPVQRKDSLFSWDVGAVYFIVPQLSLFAGYQNSRYPIFNTEEPESIGGAPEGGKQIEAGVRLALGNALTISTALFQVDRDSVFSVFVNPVTGLDQPAVFSYRVKGWEGDLNATPLPNWHVIANFSLQGPKISSFPQTPASVGKLVPSDPKFLANLWTSYSIPLGENAGMVRVSAGLRYRGKSFTDVGNTRIIPKSTVVDAGLSWSSGKFDVGAGVNNVFDKTQWLGGAGAGGGAIPAPGRTFFGRIGVRL